MPPFAQVCLAVLVGAAAAPSVGGPPWAWALCALGLAGGSLARRGQLRAAGFAIGLLLVGTVAPGPVLSGPVSVVGVRVGAAAGRQGDVAVVRWAVPGAPFQPATGRVRVRFPERPPPAGTPVVAFGRAGSPQRALPGAPDPVRAAALVGVRTELVAARWARIGGEVTPPVLHDPTGVLRAVALGDRSGVAPETVSRLRRTGTSHLLAISGFHVGVVAMCAGGVVAAVLRLAALRRPAGLSTRWGWVFGVVAALAYTLIAGAPISAQRAVGLLTIVAIGRLVGRGTEPLSVLGLVAVVLVARDPGALASPGMQLSFGAVVGLLVGLPAAARWRPAAGARRWVFDGLATSVAATLGTLPAAAWWFQGLAPLSPLANLFAVPWMGLAIAPCAGLALLAPEPLGTWGGVAGTWAVRALVWALAPFDCTPLAPAVGPAGAVALAVALWLAVRSPTLGTLLCALTLGLRPVPRTPTLTVLDVGQGDALLVEQTDGTRWLVDTGPPYAGVLPWLRRRGIRRLDRLVLTHGHRDHAGGAAAVQQALRIGAVWTPGAAGPDPPGLLHPAPDAPVDPGNADSAVLAIGPFLLTGDLDAVGEARVAPQLRGRVPVLKVPHHGSRTSSSDLLLEAAAPALAVVSAGRDNRYGHPHAEVVARYAAHGVPLLGTHEHGTLVIEVAPGRITARDRRGAMLIVPIDAPRPPRPLDVALAPHPAP